jgi:GNAT superfamily N-acetyltransferase
VTSKAGSADDPIPGWRTTLGASAALWSAGGRLEVEPHRWLAFSGARAVDYNAILCHGPDGAADLARSLEEVRAAKVPAVIMVAGAALGMTNLLAGEGWVCVGAKPLMVMTDVRGDVDPTVRRLRPEELPAAHEMISLAFDVTVQLAEVALPSVAADAPRREAWGLFEGDELRSCVAAVTVDDTLVIWSMATPPDLQRRGYGRRLLSTILASSRDAGVTTAVLYASPPGEPLYRSIGFRLVEHWQVWSRARWVFPPV